MIGRGSGEVTPFQVYTLQFAGISATVDGQAPAYSTGPVPLLPCTAAAEVQ